MSLSLRNENLLFQSSPLIIKIPAPQKILIIFNPISSAGNTEVTAVELAKELMRQGKVVEVLPSEKKAKGYSRIADKIEENDLVVVAATVRSETTESDRKKPICRFMPSPGE